MVMKDMERTLLVLAAAAALALGTGCSKNDVYDGRGGEICFSLPPIKLSSKASSDRASGEGAPLTRASFTAFDKTQTFGSSAYSLPSGKVWKNDAASSEVFIDKEEISYGGGQWKAWKSGRNYYWRHDNSSLSFLSWHPYDQMAGGLSITDAREFSYTGWTMSATAGWGYVKNSDGDYVRNTADGSVDLLLAKSLDRTSNDSSAGVLTEFVHQLCNVRFLATIMDEPTGGEEWHVTKVELSDIYTKANLLKAATPTVNTQIWGGHSDAVTYTYDTSSSPIDLVYTDPITEVEIFPQTLMLPQSVLYIGSGTGARAPKITITYNDQNGDAKTLSGYLATNTVTGLTTWLSGKSITYHIYISTRDYWIDFDADVEAWTDGTGQDIIIGG